MRRAARRRRGRAVRRGRCGSRRACATAASCAARARSTRTAARRSPPAPRRGKYAHTASNMQPTHAGIDQLLTDSFESLPRGVTLITSLPLTASWTLHRQPRGATTRWSPPTYTASVPASDAGRLPTGAPASAGTSGRRSRPRRGSERSGAWSRPAPLAPDAATASASRPQKADTATRTPPSLQRRPFPGTHLPPLCDRAYRRNRDVSVPEP